MKSTSQITLIIVGISGDLARRHLLPALFSLSRDGLVANLNIIGTSRRKLDHDILIKQSLRFVKEEGTLKQDYAEFVESITLIQTDFTKDKDLHKLNEKLIKIERLDGVCSKRLFYLAVPSTEATAITNAIGKHDLVRCGHSNSGAVLVEKPFGADLSSAVELCRILTKHLNEDQIYRIDHYLAKETAQNISFFRFSNPLVHDLWSSRFIDHIQITVAENIGIEGRVDFYERTGAIRDMVQSHIVQLIGLITMENPNGFTARSVRSKRLHILKKIIPINIFNDVVLGQYQGYQKEVRNMQSNRETFVAIKLKINDPKWFNVPIYLRTGKALEEKVSEITLVYRDKLNSLPVNMLTVRIQPNEGIALKLSAKKPGLSKERQEVVMDYCYERSGHLIKHTAYEKLLIDALSSDQTLFPSTEEVLVSWRLLDPLIRAIDEGQLKPKPYSNGSWGPVSSNELLQRDGREWLSYDRRICRPHIEFRQNSDK